MQPDSQSHNPATDPATLRVCPAQIEVTPGRPVENTGRMLAVIEQARSAGADLVVFPELAISGYLLGDTWEQPAFLRECAACGERVREAARGLTVIFGNVAVDWRKRNEDGRPRKYNALFTASEGAFHGPAGGAYPFVIKTLLPNYREFDDSRHFFDLRKLAQESGVAPAALVAPVSAGRVKIGCVLCEDAWDADYHFAPLAALRAHAPDLYVNCSCSPFTRGKAGKRRRVFAAQAVRLGRPLICVNALGMQNIGKTVYVFDGASAVYDGAEREILLPSFESAAPVLDIPLDGRPFGAPAPAGGGDDLPEIFQALLAGARRFLQRCGIERVVVGLSGGIDSAVAAALYRQVLPPERLLAVNLPSRHNSLTTINLARQTAANLGCLYAEIPIDESVEMTVRQLNGLRVASVDGALRRELHLTEGGVENIQARDRSARVLAAVAAAFGGAFTCNANKTEAAVGYSTLYGDLGGFLALLGDLWKGEVYRLGRHLNREVYRRDVIPEACFTLKPSAELSAAQDVDRGLGDPLHYPYHDCLFASWVERWDRAGPEENLEWYLAGALERQLGYAGSVRDIFSDAAAFVADLEYWWRQFQGLGLAKRIQAPPVMAVTRRAFGFDFREAQNGPWFSARYEELKRQALSANAAAPRP